MVLFFLGGCFPVPGGCLEFSSMDFCSVPTGPVLLKLQSACESPGVLLKKCKFKFWKSGVAQKLHLQPPKGAFY